MTSTQSRPPAGGDVSYQEARQVAEAARETEWAKPSFGKELFLGRFRLDLIDPWPTPDPATAAKGEEFLAKLDAYMRSEVDGQQIERDARIPDEVFQGLARLGAFGMKIDEKYGGLGLTNLHYCRALMLVGSVNPSIGALLSAHQSIGVPQPLKIFGTDEQKQKFLPRLAGGEVSAFLLTEPDVGSDPARLGTIAEPGRGRLQAQRRQAVGHQRHGRHAARGDGAGAQDRGAARRHHRVRRRGRLARASPWSGATRSSACAAWRTASPASTTCSCRPTNVIGGEGRGLKIALTTLNTGRLSLPAMCVGAGKWSLNVAREWSADARPVGTAGRSARGGGHEARLHRRDHVRHGDHARPVLHARRRRRTTTSASRRRWSSCSRARWPG